VPNHCAELAETSEYAQSQSRCSGLNISRPRSFKHPSRAAHRAAHRGHSLIIPRLLAHADTASQIAAARGEKSQIGVVEAERFSATVGLHHALRAAPHMSQTLFFPLVDGVGSPGCRLETSFGSELGGSRTGVCGHGRAMPRTSFRGRSGRGLALRLMMWCGALCSGLVLEAGIWTT
jgi:hypothetical protein